MTMAYSKRPPMIGHKSERHRDFGWAAARFDDLVNLPASRLAGLTIVLAAPFLGKNPSAVFDVMLRDAGRHRSPNAGWPEAAMAAVLGLALAGPRQYPGYTVDDPFMNESGRREATATDIDRALKVLVAACGREAPGLRPGAARGRAARGRDEGLAEVLLRRGNS